MKNEKDHVIALHCSGAGAGQWRRLAETLGHGFALTAPEHYGCDSTGPWCGQGAFTLAEEAERTLALIDAAPAKVHLVGHSYGGGLALHIALRRPDRIASLSLYEPSAFHLLKQAKLLGAKPLAEIAGVADQIGTGVAMGDYHGAAAVFIDYWGGAGAWNALRPEMQDAIVRWMPKAPLDFEALLDEPTRLAAYGRLTFPVLVVRGEHAPAPTRTIAELLPTLMPAVRSEVVAGAGHMGPVTHPRQVNALIASHIATVAGRFWLFDELAA